MTHPNPLHGIHVAILVEDGFEQVEMVEPRQALYDAGATSAIVSPQKKQVRGWNGDDKGDEFTVDQTIVDANPSDFDALLIPGGVRSPDRLRTNNKAVLFLQAFHTAKKPIAAICHGPWMLIEAGIARGKKLTAYKSLHTDVLNAGGDWLDQAAVLDDLLLTSRNPGDLPKFNKAMVELFTPVKV